MINCNFDCFNEKLYVKIVFCIFQKVFNRNYLIPMFDSDFKNELKNYVLISLI